MASTAVPPPRIDFASLPHELQCCIFPLLPTETLKSIRRVCTRWAYIPAIVDLLFDTVPIVPHSIAFDRFERDFSRSTVKHSIRELKICVTTYLMSDMTFGEIRGWQETEDDGCDTDEEDKSTSMNDSGADLDPATNLATNADNINEDDSDEYSKAMDMSQPVLLQQLIDFFNSMPLLRRVSWHPSYIRYLESIFHQEPEPTPWSNDSEVYCGQYGLEDEGEHTPQPIHPLCLLIKPHESWSIEKNAPKGIWLNDTNWSQAARPEFTFAATVWLAVWLSESKVEKLDIKFLYSFEAVMIKCWWDWIRGMHRMYQGVGEDLNSIREGVSDRNNRSCEILDLKHLKITFDDYTITTTNNIASRFDLFRMVPNLEALEAQWLYQTVAPLPVTGQSALSDIKSLNTNPLFTRLTTLDLCNLRCRAHELLYFLDHHCPSLHDLTLRNLEFIYQRQSQPDCLVQFLKQLKISCGHKINTLEISDSLRASSGSAGYVSKYIQDWYVAASPLAPNPEIEGPRLKERVLKWFHDPDLSDAHCPLNACELRKPEDDVEIGEHFDGDEQYAISDESWRTTDEEYSDGGYVCYLPAYRDGSEDSDTGFGLFD